MNLGIKHGRLSAIAIAAVVLIFVALAVVARSEWFSNYLRERVVFALEDKTGATVNIRKFIFDWKTFTCELDDLTLRGTEPESSAPWMHADSIRFRLPLLAMLRGPLRIPSLVVKRPSISIIIRQDGTTNIAALLAHAGSRPSLSVVFDRLSAQDALVQINDRAFAVGMEGSGMSVSLLREARSDYRVHVACDQVQLDSPGSKHFKGGLSFDGKVGQGGILARHFALSSSEFAAHGSGTLSRLSDPMLGMAVTVNADAAWAASAAHFEGVKAGRIAFSGNISYDRLHGFRANGVSEGKDLAYSAGRLRINALEGRTKIRAGADGALLENVVATASEGAFAGTVELLAWRDAVISGQFAHLNVGRFIPGVGAVASGPVQARWSLTHPQRTLRLRSELTVKAIKTGVPVDGLLDASYDASNGTLAIDNLDIHAQNTRLQCSGIYRRAIRLQLRSDNAVELTRILHRLKLYELTTAPIELTPASTFSFAGELTGAGKSAKISGEASLTVFRFYNSSWQTATVRASIDAAQAEISSARVRNRDAEASLNGTIALDDWQFSRSSSLNVHGSFRGADVGQILLETSLKPAAIRGSAAGSFQLTGSLNKPYGNVSLSLSSLDTYGQLLNTIRINAAMHGDTVGLTAGRVEAGPASIAFSGSYTRPGADWRTGTLTLHVHSNGFPLKGLSLVKRYAPEISGAMAVYGDTSLRFQNGSIVGETANGSLALTALTVNSTSLGNLTSNIETNGDNVEASFSLAGRIGHVSGRINVEPGGGQSIAVVASGEDVEAATLAGLVRDQFPMARLEGKITGDANFKSSLRNPSRYDASLRIRTATIRLPQAGNIEITNSLPIRIEAENGIAHIRSLHLKTAAGVLQVTGDAALRRGGAILLQVDCAVALEAVELLQSNVTASGSGLLTANIQGTTDHPRIDGVLKIRDASGYLQHSLNGVNHVRGAIQFTGNRAMIRDLSGNSGGGQFHLAGVVDFSSPGALDYSVNATAIDVRVEPVPGISVTSNASLHLTGTGERPVLSGDVTLNRIVIDPQGDLGALIMSGRAPQTLAVYPEGIAPGLQMDVRISNSPDLQINTALSRDVRAIVDLHLRGTLQRPQLIGEISAEEGDLRVFGAKYSINRCAITFTNTSRIEPILDLDLQTVSRGVTVDITVSGTLNKLNFNYRSDPPLQPKDIVALLTVGQPPSFAPTTTPAIQASIPNFGSLQSTATTVLGQAISPSANRLSRLFGVTNIKLDPIVTGVTVNTPQSRLTLEQQISSNVTVTYVTNLAQTSEQIFRFEWALNPQYSIIAVRDDNGEFGIDLQYKKRF